MNIKIAPSLFAANFAYLADDVKKIANAEYIHVDVMDGHFVPNFGIAPPHHPGHPSPDRAGAGRASDDHRAHPLCGCVLQRRC